MEDIANVVRKDGKSKKVVHSCPHCNFTTVMSQHMKSHLEAHERHRGQMYRCDVCNMEFSQKANMHRHRMRHSGFKPYECRYCKKRFFRKDQMQEHSMTHIKTGEDFDCPVGNCEARFRQHSALRTHLDENHVINANNHAPCKRCSMTFANSRRLLLHYQTKHDDNNMGIKRERSYSDEDPDLSGTPAKRSSPVSTPTSASVVNPQVPLFNFPFPNSSLVDFFSTNINWNALNLPVNRELSVAVSQALPVNSTTSFSPHLLPKSNLPNYLQMFNNHYTPLPAASDNKLWGERNSSLNKLVEELTKAANPQPWSTEVNSTTTSGCDENSDIHSPTSDSRTSSTPLQDLQSDESTQNLVVPTQIPKPVSPTATANVMPKAIIDCKHELPRTPPPTANLISSIPVEQITNIDAKKTDDAEDKRFDCTHCGIMFTDSMLYCFHKTLHASDNPWRCGLCARECSDRFEFTAHIVQDRH
ncbi:Ikaros DNA-binding protein [Aphelenchoides besseyi]|nr:Ikaros DNA-binding protein [Aphelenchoides besseyi]